MFIKVEPCSNSDRPSIGKNDDNFDRIHHVNRREESQNDTEKQPVSFNQNQTKHPRLGAAADGNESNSKRVKRAVNYDEPLGFLEGHDFDIFNTDDDRQELIDYCERMLEECDDHTESNKSSTYPQQHHHPHSEAAIRQDSAGAAAGEHDHDDSRCSMGPRSSFDNALRRSSVNEEPPRLKSAYYFDGQRFVAIQVVMDSGKCQLVLPIDHPHHLGVPEEVPVFETKSVPAEKFIKH